MQTSRKTRARPKPRFVRETADVRRRALILATARCLAEKGVAGASVRAICARAGVSSGLLTHYFDGVDSLILATYREIGTRVSDATKAAVDHAGPDPRARLSAFLQANFFPPILDADLLATWIPLWSLVKTDARISAAHAEIYGGVRERTEQLLIQAAPDMSAVKARLAAIGLSALIDGLWLELCLDPSSFSAEEARLIVDRAMIHALDGYGSDGPFDHQTGM